MEVRFSSESSGGAGAVRLRRGWLIAALLLALGLGSSDRAQAASTYTVNTLADLAPSEAECAGASEDCSLRQALDRAQSGDTVAVPASPTPYPIARIIPVRAGVTIEGAGAAATVLSGGGAHQAFELTGEGVVTIR